MRMAAPAADPVPVRERREILRLEAISDRPAARHAATKRRLEHQIGLGNELADHGHHRDGSLHTGCSRERIPSGIAPDPAATAAAERRTGPSQRLHDAPAKGSQRIRYQPERIRGMARLLRLPR